MKKLLAFIALFLALANPALSQTVPLGPRFVLPYQTGFDTTGMASPGALLNFYISGTNTRLNTYADPLLTTPNPNPVQANAAGLFPNIFLNGDYKVVLTDSSFNQIWTADPVSSGSGGGGGGSGNVNGPSSSVIGDIAVWANTTGTLLSDAGQLAYVNDFLANTDFLPGLTTALTLSHAPSVAQAVAISFDGIVQAHNTYSFVGSVVTFSAPIPLNVQVVEAQYFAATSRAGVNSLNNLDGTLTLAVGGGLSLVTSGGNTLTLSAVAASGVQPPQGYLTLQNAASGGPVQGASDIVGVTTVYYSPYVGNQIPVWNGTAFSVLAFNELSLSLTSGAQLASTAYDVCVFNNAGTPVAVFGPAWTTSSGAAASRGTGAGTAQLIRQSGIWVNAVSIAANNGATPYTIPANQCTYVGSIFVDAAAGQVSAYRTWGQSRKFGVWNAYNRVPIVLLVGDSTPSWPYSTNTVRPSDGRSQNSGIAFTGLPEEAIKSFFQQFITAPTSAVYTEGQIGIGNNQTVAFSGTIAQMSILGATTGTVGSVVSASLEISPRIGAQVLTSLENTTASTPTFYGTQVNMVLQIEWRG